MLIEKILSLIGYVTKKKALALGFTHHGSYWGIPIYMDDNNDCPTICAKWIPLYCLFPLVEFFEFFLFFIFCQGEQTYFRFTKKRKIVLQDKKNEQ
jgi:hypothetical protein